MNFKAIFFVLTVLLLCHWSEQEDGQQLPKDYESKKQGKTRPRKGRKKIAPRIYPIEHYNQSFSPTYPLRDYGEKKLQKIRFLHLPKTGTTFAATVVHYGCKNLDKVYIDVLIRLNSANYQPWKLDRTCTETILNGLKTHRSRNGNWWPHKPFISGVDEGYTVSMFREPSSRLASQLLHMFSLYGRSVAFGIDHEDIQPIIGILKGKTLTPELESHIPVPVVDLHSPTGFKNGASNFTAQMEAFKASWKNCDNLKGTSSDRRNCKWKTASMYPGLTGCMTKMIIGRGCCDKYDITTDDITEAKRRMREDFAFIGLQERWNTSVEMFHLQHGGKLFCEELEIRRAADRPVMKGDMQRAVKSSIVDPWDLEIYEYAKFLFDKLVEKYRNDLTVKWSFS